VNGQLPIEGDMPARMALVRSEWIENQARWFEDRALLRQKQLDRQDNRKLVFLVCGALLSLMVWVMKNYARERTHIIAPTTALILLAIGVVAASVIVRWRQKFSLPAQEEE